MPFTAIPLPVLPDEPVTAEVARPILAEFVEWVRKFFMKIELLTKEGGSLLPLFVPEQIAYFPNAFAEVDEGGIFKRAVTQVQRMSAEAIKDRGLYGAQLKWKLSNIDYWQQRFVKDQTAWILDGWLDVIDALLESLNVSHAIVELKEAVRGSLDKRHDG